MHYSTGYDWKSEIEYIFGMLLDVVKESIIILNSLEALRVIIGLVPIVKEATN